MPPDTWTFERKGDALTALRECSCAVPNPKPQKSDTCVRCGYHLAAEWTTSDATMAAFFDRIEEGFPTWPSVPEWWLSLRLQCEARELAGRKPFGYRYLARDNIAEAFEEISDGMNYLHLEILKSRREGAEPEMDLVLTVAENLANAYKGLVELRHKHRGAP